MKFPRPRFSLLTLLLGVLFIGSGILVWIQRDAWELERQSVGIGIKTLKVAPDEKRGLNFSLLQSIYQIIDLRTRKVLHDFTIPDPPVVQYYGAGFLDDDHFLVMISYDLPLFKPTKPPLLTHYYFYRRFPEWWWGHLYRPEVRLALIFGIATLVSLFKTRSVGAAGFASGAGRLAR